MFPEPLPVTAVSDDGQYVFVEGSTTGLPIGEVTVVVAANQTPGADLAGGEPKPPPFAPLRPGMKQETFSLEAGDLTVRWPAKLSPDELKDVEDWLDILKRKIQRAAKSE